MALITLEQASPILIAQEALNLAYVYKASRQDLLKTVAQQRDTITVQGQIIGHLRKELARMAKRP